MAIGAVMASKQRQQGCARGSCSPFAAGGDTANTAAVDTSLQPVRQLPCGPQGTRWRALEAKVASRAAEMWRQPGADRVRTVVAACLS
jgi:hypothetical protein